MAYRYRFPICYENKRPLTESLVFGVLFGESAYLLACAGLHASGSVFLDCSILGCLVDSLMYLRKKSHCLLGALGEGHLAHLFDRVLHGLLAARIEYATTYRDALCFSG